MSQPTTDTSRIDQPFRDNPQFWASVAASADAVVALVVAAFAAAAIALSVGGAYPVLAFLLVVPFAVRASRSAKASSDATRPCFSDRKHWRDAERAAVAAAFLPMLWRRRSVRAAS